jgi:hypothetical protein
MKKFLFVFLLVSLLSIQKSNAQGLSYQFFGGGNLSYYTVKYDFGIKGIDTSFTTDSKFSFNLGFAAKYDFIRLFGLKLEAQYVRKSGKISTNRVGTTPGLTAVQRTYDSYSDYIQLGLLPQLNLPVITKSNIYLTAGPYYSFSLASKESILEQTLLQERNYSKDISNNLQSYDAGIIMGIGLEYLESPGVGITGGFRYSAGIQNILNIPDKDKITMRNNSFNFNLGIIFK